MIRLLVVFKSDDYFPGQLELLGTYKDANKAINDGLSVWDNTVEYMFINQGNEWLKIERTSLERTTLSEVQKKVSV